MNRRALLAGAAAASLAHSAIVRAAPEEMVFGAPWNDIRFDETGQEPNATRIIIQFQHGEFKTV